MELTAVWKDILTELRQRGDLNIANEKDKNRILRNKGTDFLNNGVILQKK